MGSAKGLAADLAISPVKRVLREGGELLLRRIAPELAEQIATKGARQFDALTKVKPKINFPNQPKWREAIANYSDVTTSDLLKFADDGGDEAVTTVQKMIEADAGGNSEPLFKWTTSKSVHRPIPETTRLNQQPEAVITRPSGEIKADLEEWQDLAAVRLDAVEMSKVKTAKGDIQGKVFPGNPEELLEQADQYIKLREELQEALIREGAQNPGFNPNKTGYYQSRSGWQKYLGNVLDEKGFPMRLSGGQKTSGGRPLKLEKAASQADRVEALRGWAGDFKQEGIDRDWAKTLLDLEGHHMGTAAKEADIFSRLELPDGSIGRRSQEDLLEIDEILAVDSMYMGDKGKNLAGQTKLAHRGVGGNEGQKQLASHESLKAFSDIEGIRNWQSEAENVKFELPPSTSKDGVVQNRRPTWFKFNAKRQLIDKNGRNWGTIAELRKTWKKQGDVKAVEFKIGGRTYEPGQKHGFSLEFQRFIARLKDPKDVAAAIKLYYFVGIPAKRRGSATLAYHALQGVDPMGGPGGIPVDPKSRQMYRESIPEMLDVMNDLKDQPGFRSIPEFQAVIKPFEEISRELAGKNN